MHGGNMRNSNVADNTQSQNLGERMKVVNDDEMMEIGMHFDDTVLWEETQLENLEGGTQVFDDLGDLIHMKMGSLEGETQVWDEAEEALGTQLVINEGETQRLDDNEDLAQTRLANIEGETQLLDDNEVLIRFQSASVEGGTQLLDDNEVLIQTQSVNIEGDTQVLDDLEDMFQTQSVNLAGETQVQDDFDYLEDLCTELVDDQDDRVVDDSDDEITNETEALIDTKRLSHNYSASKDGCGSIEEKNMWFDSIGKQVEKGSLEGTPESREHIPDVTPLDQGTLEVISGSVPRRFTSVRAASLRASGLAARRKALDGTNSGSCCAVNASTSLEQLGDENDEKSGKIFATGIREEADCDLGEHRNNRERASRSKGRVGSSTARKLFTEDVHADNKSSNDEVLDDERIDSSKLPSNNNDLAGLSYVESQEPGDLAQACALDFVDRFLEGNIFDFDQVGYGELPKEKSNPLKGVPELAKKAHSKTTIEKAGIFEWDDNREDEGGGDFFCRMKDEFLKIQGHGRRSLPLNGKVKKCKTDNLGDKREWSTIHDKKKNFAHSDSRLLHLSKENGKAVAAVEMKTKRNLANELNEESNGSLPKEESRDWNLQDMLNVGPDTQVAAEAMEALFHGDLLGNLDANDNGGQKIAKISRKGAKNRVSSDLQNLRKRECLDSGVITRLSKRTKRIGAKPSEGSVDSEPVKTRPKREKSRNEKLFITTKNEDSKHMQGEGDVEQKSGDEVNRLCGAKKSSGHVSVKKQLKGVSTSDPIGRRTRSSASLRLSSSEIPTKRFDDAMLRDREPTDLNLCVKTCGARVDALSYPRGKRTRRTSSGQVEGESKLDSPVIQSERGNGSLHVTRRRRLESDRNALVGSDAKRKTRASASASDFSSAGRDALSCDLDNLNRKILPKALASVGASKRPNRKSDTNHTTPAKCESTNVRLEESPRERSGPSNSTCTTPINHFKSSNAPSPICIGNEYFEQTCKKSLLRSEVNGLVAGVPKPTYAFRDSTRRRDMADVRVLFSRHLDEEIIKQQIKIVERLGASVASSVSDASHFITDTFVRTRNMLEAIACGKPVVTHLWLESCNQTNCVIDEKSYILRDTKKEKEFGFSLPVSLARAGEHPLLQNQRVLITLNTKPGKEIIASLVRAVHGQPVERIGRSALKDDKIPDDLLILSCEEDYAVCEPFLEKGAAIYSSELLLNGIVTQRLDYERYRIFEDHVKRTRSTIRMRRGGNQFLPVNKCK